MRVHGNSVRRVFRNTNRIVGGAYAMCQLRWVPVWIKKNTDVAFQNEENEWVADNKTEKEKILHWVNYYLSNQVGFSNESL